MVNLGEKVVILKQYDRREARMFLSTLWYGEQTTSWTQLSIAEGYLKM